MMKHPFAIALTTAFLLIAVTPARSGTQSLPLEQQVDAVAARLEGVMSTAAQSKINAKVSNVRMTTCRVAVPNVPSQGTTIVLYQEQALVEELANPYRQRFLELSASPISQSVRSRSFKPATPAAWVNFCSKAASDRTVKPQDLGSVVCSVFLRSSGENYVGNTPADGCPAKIRGAVRIKNHIVLQPDGMNTWDQGFDAAGKQVWGAKAEAYQFRREP